MKAVMYPLRQDDCAAPVRGQDFPQLQWSLALSAEEAGREVRDADPGD